MIIGLMIFSYMSIHALKKSLFQSLQGVSVVIDAGHGGKDQGAIVNQIAEAPLNLAIAQQLAKILEENGAIVTMTRQSDVDLASIHSIQRKKEDMKKRSQIINDEKNDLFISLHLNIYPHPEVKGAQVFHNDKVLAMNLASFIQEELNDLSKPKTIRLGDYYLLNEARIPGVLIECGFLSNPDEWLLLQKEEYQNKIALAIFAGIRNFLQMMSYE